MRQAIQQSSLASETIQRLIERVDALESSAGPLTFEARYKEFIGLAADHISVMTVIAPYLPALLKLLTG